MQNQNQAQAGPTKAKAKMFAVLHNPSAESAQDQVMLVEANTRKELARALADHPNMKLLVALRGKQLVAQEKRTVHFS